MNAALVVRDLRRTSEAETLVTATRLKSLGIDAIGIAENFLPPPAVKSPRRKLFCGGLAG